MRPSATVICIEELAVRGAGVRSLQTLGASAVVRAATTVSLRRSPFPPVLAAELARCHADEPVERTREARLVAETGLASDIDERRIGEREQLSRALDPSLNEPAMATDTEARLGTTVRSG